MGTRGALGVRLGGHDKIAYNHFDSYPDALGHDTIKALTVLLADRPTFEQAVKDLQPVPKDAEGNAIKPTPEQIEKLKQYADTGVSNQSLTDWYCLLRQAQGDLQKTVCAGFYEDSNDFMKDSLFCEYAYIANLDDHVLECYVGFQNKEHKKGRYAALDVQVDKQKAQNNKYGDNERVYYPVALLGTIPFGLIEVDPVAAVAKMDKLYGDYHAAKEAQEKAA